MPHKRTKNITCTDQMVLTAGVEPNQTEERGITYKAGVGLPVSIIKEVKPSFSRLSSNELLGLWPHGKTQNQNESLESLSSTYGNVTITLTDMG